MKLDTIADLDALREAQIREGRTIEYKQTLPGSSNGDRKEFLADVSSFANASGGDLIYGIDEEDGLPKKISGLSGICIDDVKLRLDAIMQSGLAPRVLGIQIKEIQNADGFPVLVINIPKSWNSPHAVWLEQNSKFWSRNNAGKYQMDITEIRSAIALSDSIPERIRRFRDERLAQIFADDGHFHIPDGPKLILHLIPISSLTSRNLLDVKEIQNYGSAFSPPGAGGYSSRLNLDGYLSFSGNADDGNFCYCQAYRSVIVEGVTARLVNKNKIGCVFIEKLIYESFLKYMKGIEKLGIGYPFVLLVTMTGVRGVSLAVDSYQWEEDPFDRDRLIFPDVLIENISDPLDIVLKPICDGIWNAAGHTHSRNYDDKGRWRPINPN